MNIKDHIAVVAGTLAIITTTSAFAWEFLQDNFVTYEKLHYNNKLIERSAIKREVKQLEAKQRNSAIQPYEVDHLENLKSELEDLDMELKR